MTAGALRVGFTEDARAQLAAIKVWWQANRHGAPDALGPPLRRVLLS